MLGEKFSERCGEGNAMSKSRKPIPQHRAPCPRSKEIYLPIPSKNQEQRGEGHKK